MSHIVACILIEIFESFLDIIFLNKVVSEAIYILIEEIFVLS